MSTIKLKKEAPAYPGRKAGEVFSVPFIVGKQLVEEGVAEYPPSIPAKRTRAAIKQKPNLRPQDAPTPTRGEPPTARAEEVEEDDYDSMTNEQLHKLAHERNIDGRSALTTKDQLVKALEKDDKAKGKK